ncbi:hypothetical protein [Roseivirga pacifica]|uniref:hypothetical protein n=1 Tax=Roseivirga pacifica TaxID=1267423 RepID=UPI003BB070BD
MTTSFKDEFKTVYLILESDSKTKGIDSFSLALIKSERQIRKLFTHLRYQYPEVKKASYSDIRGILNSKWKVYFEGFINGFDQIYPVKIGELIGEEYSQLLEKLSTYTKVRNKVFHGQITNDWLSTKDLEGMTQNIMLWCQLLSKGAKKELDYDGFERNSLRASKKDLLSKFLVQINSLDEYSGFIDKEMSR